MHCDGDDEYVRCIRTDRAVGDSSVSSQHYMGKWGSEMGFWARDWIVGRRGGDKGAICADIR